jgi:hypothetical protein
MLNKYFISKRHRIFKIILTGNWKICNKTFNDILFKIKDAESFIKKFI